MSKARVRPQVASDALESAASVVARTAKWKRVSSKNHIFKLPADESKEDIRDITNKDLWKGFQENTTSHGLSRCATTKGRTKTIIWAALTIGFLCAMLAHGSFLIYNYFQYPTAYSLKVETNTELPFPAVTVCNVNPLLLNEVMAIPSLTSLVGSSTPTSGRRKRQSGTPPPAPSPPVPASAPPAPATSSPTSPPGAPNNSAGPTPPSALTTSPNSAPATPSATTTIPPVAGPAPSPPSSSFGGGSGFSGGGKPPVQQVTRYLTSMQVLEEVANYNMSTKSSLSTVREDFILECVYAGFECSISDFYETFNNAYGNCFTFNAGWNTSISKLVTSRAGPANGLELTLNIDQDSYLSTTEVAGARILVHDADTMPFIEDQGISLSPGTATHVGVLQKSVTRKPAPYGDCLELLDDNGDYISQEARDIYETIYPVHYSQTGCLKTCYQKRVIASCGCADSTYPMEGPALGSTSAQACSVIDTNQTECMQDVLEMYQSAALDCDCPMSCSEVSYSPVVSSLLWPSTAAELSVKARLSNLSSSADAILYGSTNPEKYRQNFLSVTVFLEALTCDLIAEEAAYGGEKMFADMGGAFGLWMGASFFTFFEMFELLADLMLLSHKKKLLKKRPN